MSKRETEISRILNLFAGLGGNRKYWKGNITSVEYDSGIVATYRKLYPKDKIICADVLEWIVSQDLDQYDFIWASPPCKTHSRLNIARKIKRIPDLNSLYGLILYLKTYYKGKYCVENVIPFYTPLIQPTVILGRHVFWTNFKVQPKIFNKIKGFIAKSQKQLSEHWGFPYEIIKNMKVRKPGYKTIRTCLRNVCDPDIGEYILMSA